MHPAAFRNKKILLVKDQNWKRYECLKVDYIFLAGGGASMPGLSTVVTEHTGFACNVSNPFDGMEIGRSVREQKLTKEAPSYLTACGLAMRRFLK